MDRRILTFIGLTVVMISYTRQKKTHFESWSIESHQPKKTRIGQGYRRVMFALKKKKKSRVGLKKENKII